ncbi:hypothetical protein GCM10009565_51520 [Amycolatopsis albidoflavus]
MSEPRIAALIPPGAPRRIPEPSRLSEPLPLPPQPPEHERAAWRYSIVKLDASGRLASRALLEALGWSAETPLTHALRLGPAVLIRSDRYGTATADRDLRVKLPAALRARCALRTGDPVLLAASPTHQILLIYTVPFLDELLSDAHQHISSGGQDR